MTKHGISKTMSRPALAAALLGAAAALSACAGGEKPAPYMQSVHYPVVSQQLLMHDVMLASDGSIPEAQRRSLAEWFQSLDMNYGDRVSIDDSGAGAAARRRTVAGVLADFGLLLSAEPPVTRSRVAPGTARVVIMRAEASVPDCPDWRRPSNPELEASTMSNFGCATMSNLAAMVVDANDLVSGKPHSGTDAITTISAIETFRDSAGKGKEKVKNTAGSVSGGGGGGGGGGH